MSSLKRTIVRTADGSPTILEENSNATFHSMHGALAESEHIFITNGLRYIFSLFQDPVRVLEIGFGTGLNAALTLRTCRETGRTVHYTGIEKFPLDPVLTEQYAANFDDQLAGLVRSVNSAHPVHTEVFTLKKDICDFSLWQPPSTPFHLVYFDAFGPGTVPELWTEAIFQKLAGCLLPGAGLVTFCAQGEMRRALKRAGFRVERLQGAPGKREMTRAIRL